MRHVESRAARASEIARNGERPRTDPGMTGNSRHSSLFSMLLADPKYVGEGSEMEIAVRYLPSGVLAAQERATEPAKEPTHPFPLSLHLKNTPGDRSFEFRMRSPRDVRAVMHFCETPVRDGVTRESVS